jgi:hypothetical protein
MGAFEVEHDVRMGALSDHSGLENCIEGRRADVFGDHIWDLG